MILTLFHNNLRKIKDHLLEQKVRASVADSSWLYLTSFLFVFLAHEAID